jgi:hypothetical protein
MLRRKTVLTITHDIRVPQLKICLMAAAAIPTVPLPPSRNAYLMRHFTVRGPISFLANKSAAKIGRFAELNA